MSAARRCSALCLLVVLSACTKESDGLTEEQRSLLEANVASVPPSPRFPLDLVFDRRLRLVGYDIDRTEWRPGEPLALTWYWEVLAPPAPGSRVLHELEAPGRIEAQRLPGRSELREVYPLESWRAGRFVRDTYVFDLPAGWDAPSATIRMALVSEDGAQTTTPPITVSTLMSQDLATRSLPVLAAVKTRSSPRLDGDLADSAWVFARPSGAFVDARSGGATPVKAVAKALWDSRYLYVGVSVEEPRTRQGDGTPGPPCASSCVVLAIAPNVKSGEVFEFRVSPLGSVEGARFNRGSPKAARLDTRRSDLVRAAVSTRETPADEADSRYTVEIAIPWQAFSPQGEVFAPPSVGDRARLNVEIPGIGGGGRKDAAWSPSGADDFHVLDRLGILRFVGAPEEMDGSSEPTELPEGRMPAPMKRSANPAVRDALLQRNADEKNRLDAVRGARQSPQSLESSEGGR